MEAEDECGDEDEGEEEDLSDGALTPKRRPTPPPLKRAAKPPESIAHLRPSHTTMDDSETGKF